MKILVANLGSTSLKYRLFDFTDGRERLVTRGGFERVTDYAQTIDDCLRQLLESGAITAESDLDAIGFKTVVAKDVSGCVRLDESVVQAMEAYNGIAPAHNPPYITGIRLFATRMPAIPLVGLFETAFFQWAPEAAQRYAVPEEWFHHGVRRWGFHGASHKYIAERSAELLGREDVAAQTRRLYVDGPASGNSEKPLRIISCHLGGSSSISGIRNGVAIGNSLGMSPQSGLPHNNRVGELDAFALPYLLQTTRLDLKSAVEMMCRDSGMKGLSGVSNDIRDITAAAEAGNARAQLALDVLVHNVRHWIGSYHLQLNGIDALAFTAGIGENQSSLRQAICADLDQLGIALDPAANESLRGTEGVISAPEARVKILVIPTNEELVVAREVKRFLEKATSEGRAHAQP